MEPKRYRVFGNVTVYVEVDSENEDKAQTLAGDLPRSAWDRVGPVEVDYAEELE